MQDNESVEAIASGSEWVVAYTDQGYLRFFSHSGVQKYIVNEGLQIVTMAGYENLLAIIYHAGLPLYDSQNLKCKIIDTKTYKTIHNGNCPVSNKSELTWVGFSEEGMLTIIDSYGVVSGFNFKNFNFVPLTDLKEKFPNNYR